jgi:hypothetical protein
MVNAAKSVHPTTFASLAQRQVALNRSCPLQQLISQQMLPLHRLHLPELSRWLRFLSLALVSVQQLAVHRMLPLTRPKVFKSIHALLRVIFVRRNFRNGTE